MYEIQITSAEKITVQSDGSTLLAVGFDVLKDGEKVVGYNHGFNLDTTQDEVEAYLADFKANYIANQERAEVNAEFDAANAVADATIAALADGVII